MSVAGGEVTGVDAGFSFSAIVNTRGDTTDDDGGASGRLQQGSLRQFLINSNAISGTQAADFSVGTGAITIAPNAALPQLTDAVMLDATTQEGFAGAPVVELNGSSAGAGASGFVLNAAASGSTIRGFVLNRFGADLIQLAGSDNNLIAGNYLGTDLTGTIDRGAGDSGVQLSGGASGNRIGGTTAADRNVISGNDYSGVNITGSGTNNNLVQGNLIGTAVNGSGALGNSSFGVVIWDGASGNQIGSATDGAGNVIANNNRGVIVDANSINAVNNAILGNRIFANNTLGIDLYPTDVRANDSGDGDSGPNNYQNYPVLTSARTDGTQINFAGTLNSTANTSFRIEFFASAAGDASGYGEAERYLGFVNVTTNGTGNASFNTWLTTAVAAGESISATATRANAGFTSFFDTSEFALNMTATPFNSAPVNTLPAPKTALEDTTLAITGLSVSDVDGNLSSVQLSVVNGMLNLSLAGGATISSGANGSASVTLTGTQAQLNAALATLTYRGSADFNGADTLTILSTDAAGLSDADNLAITVNPVNDAPVLSGASNLSTINEDPASNPGTPVSALIAGQTSDVDAGALTGIAVTAVNNTNGTWQYSTNSGTTWNAFGSPSNASARLLAADANTYVRFAPNSNWNGTIAGGLIFRAWDRTSGSAGSTANTTPNGGTSAFSAATASAGITVNPVNDLPTGLPTITGTVTEDQTLTVVTSGISDADGLGAFSYQWLRNGSSISGATASTYTLSDADVGSQISIRVGYTDGHGTAESVTSAQTAAVANVNDAPVGLPTITGTATEDQTLTANTAGISDADGIGTFSYQWLRSGVAITGATTNTHTLGDADVDTQISVRVSYTDGRGTSESLTSAAVGPVANVNDNPSGLPIITGTVAEDQTLTANTAGLSDADGLGVFSYQWLRNGVAIAGSSNSTYTLGDADVGSQISVRVSYTDGHATLESLTSAQSAAVVNVNDNPTGLPVITGSATKGQTLTAGTNGIGDEDGLGPINYQWLRDGAAITGATANTYVLGNDDVGIRISVRVSYTDGRGTPESVTSAQVGPVANVNDAPVGLPTITGTVTEDQILTADVSGISDADGLGVFSYQWLRNGSAVTGATASSYTLSDADVGTRISVQVSYTDGHGTSESLTSVEVGPVVNVNDAPVGVPTISGTVAEDQTLTADTSGVSDADGLGGFSYQWLRNGVAITGATNSNYTLGDVDVGTQISVQVSYTDGHGTPGLVTSAQTAAVANVNDAPTSLPTITGTATEDQTLTADTSGVSDADGLGVFSYQWLRDGAAITGATANTYVLGNDDVGTRISVRVSYTDGRGTPESVTSAQVGPVANVNDAPVGLPTITGTVTEDQILTADVSGISDADGLGVFSYQWLRNGSAVTGATASSYTLSDADVGTRISVQVSYTDGHGTSESLTSVEVGPVVNVNDAPVGVPTISGMVAEDQTLTAEVSGISDADGLGAYSYQWLRNGLGITGATDSTYTLGDADVDEQISLQVSYTDGHGTSESLTSVEVGPVANVNDAPVGVPTISGMVAEDQTLTAEVSGILDADGLGLGVFSYQWRRNGSAITGATASSYTLSDADVGSQISVQVRYTDGHGTNETLTSAQSAAVANINDAPTGSVTIDNMTPAEGDTLMASNTLADADGLSGPISYQWQRGGVDIAGATGDTYTTVQADVDTVISVVASYTDDQGTFESVTSAPTAAVTNVNNLPTGSVTISGTPTEDQTLTVSNTLADEDGIGSVSYQWQRNGVDIGGATGSNYVLGDADVGATITVVASYTDLHGTAESVTSAPTAAVVNVNDAPVANDDSTTTNEDTPVTVNVVGNDSDVEGDTLVVSAVTQGVNGTVTFAGGSVTYTPNANFNGSDSFTYTSSDGNGGAAIATVNVTVTPVNDAPVANNDSAATDEDTPVTVNVVANDSDVEGDTLVVSAVTQGANGTVTFAGGSVTYTPNGNFNGSDSFTYTVSDGNGGTATATVNMTVNAVNDGPVAADDSATTNEDTSITVNVVSNDSDVDGDTLVVSAVTQGVNGTVSFAGGSVTYTPSGNFNGSDSFTYTMSDGNGGTATGTVNVTVNLVNDAPVANNDSATTNEETPVTVNVLSNDIDVEGDSLVVSAVTQGTNGTVTFAGGSVTYTPTANFNGSDSFTYTVSDGNGGTASATVSVTVNPVNDAPTGAVTITGTPTEDQMLTADVPGISDADGVGAFTYQWLRNGTAITGAANSTYTLGDADVGTVITVVVRYTDGQGTHESLTSAGVGPIGNANDAPVANADSYTSAENTPLTATLGVDDLLKNDSDIDGDLLTVNPTPVRDASHGTLVLNADGTFIYTPDANFTGVDSFTYEVSDGKGGVAQATVTISVSAANPAPTGGDSTDTQTDEAEPPTASLDSPSLSLPEPPDAPVTEVLQADVLNESNLVSNQDSIKKNGLTSPSITTAFRSFLQAVSRDSRPADAVSIALNDVKESLSNREPGRDKPSTAVQKEDLQPGRADSAILVRAYEYLRNSLDAVKEEMAKDNQVAKVYLGSAIVSSIGLSVGYVVWLLRGGMLLSSLLSSLPAWQILDPLPILARKKDDDSSDEDESLESILQKKTRNKTKVQVQGSEDQGSRLNR